MLRLRHLVHEIHRRSLWQVLLIYLAGSWAVLAVVDTLAGALALPDWAPRLALFLLIIGLPVVLATAFVQEGVLPEAPRVPEEAPPEAPSEAVSPRRLFTWRNAVLGGVAAGLLWGGVAIGWFLFGRGPVPSEAMAGDADPGVAILPFDVNDAALEDLREGVPLLLATTLRSARGVRPITASTVLSNWDRSIGTGQRGSLREALGVARSSGGRYALVGSAVALGPRLRLTGELFDTRSQRTLGRVETEGARDSVWQLVDGLAVEIVKQLAVEGIGDAGEFDLAAVTTRSLPALMSYLEGEASYRRGDFDGAIAPLKAAVNEDSTFALAHLALSRAYSWAGHPEESDLHMELARRGPLPEREILFTRMPPALRRRSAEPLDDLSAFARRHPEDAQAWNVLGEVWIHAGMLVSPDWLHQATRTLGRAAAIEPGNAVYLLHPLEMALMSGDSVRARELIGGYGAVHPGSPEDRGHRAVWEHAFRGETSSIPLDSVVMLLTRLGRYGWDLAHATRGSELGEAFTLERSEVLGELHVKLCLDVPLRSGRWDRFLSYATHDQMPLLSRFLCVHGVSLSGLPVPKALLVATTENALAIDRDAVLREGGYLLGAYHADRERWAEFEALRAEIRERMETAAARGDSAGTDALSFQLRSIDGYALWRRGRPEEAYAALASLRPIHWSEHLWWLGQLALRLERPADAVRWLTPLIATVNDNEIWPHAALPLGEAYRELGDTAAAVNTYRDFVNRWRLADPELRSHVRTARARLEALASGPESGD